jgi:acetyl esterase/lipase
MRAWPASPHLFLTILLAGCLLASCGTPGAADPPRAKATQKKPDQPAVPPGVSLHADLVCGTVGQAKVKLCLDLALPKHGKQSLATIVLRHGTGPLNKGRKTLKAFILDLAQKGYVALAVGYRCPPKDVYPAAIEDVTGAIEWLRANAARYRIDRDRVGVLGFSGGGTLACLLAIKKPVRVRAVVSYSAPTDLALLYRNARGLLGCVLRRGLETLFRGSPDKVMKKYQEASPIGHVHKGAAPILFLHGEDASVVPLEHSQLLAKKLRQIGANPTLLAFANAQHDFDDRRDTNARLAAAAAEGFLRDNLKRESPPGKDQK